MQVKAIRKIKLDKSIKVYDLTVPDSENFCLANGAVVHNSGHDDAVHALVGSVTNIARNPALMTALVDSDGVAEGYRPGDTERPAEVPRRA